MKKLRNQKGITLVELIVALALISIFIMIGTNIFLLGNRSFKTGVDKASAQQDVRFVSNRIVDELKYAKSIKSTADFGADDYFKISVDANNRLVVEKFNSSNVEISESVVGDYVESVQFTAAVNADTIQLYVKSLSDIVGGGQEYDINTAVRLMNNNVGGNTVVEAAFASDTIFYTLYE